MNERVKEPREYEPPTRAQRPEVKWRETPLTPEQAAIVMARTSVIFGPTDAFLEYAERALGRRVDVAEFGEGEIWGELRSAQVVRDDFAAISPGLDAPATRQ